MNSVDLLRPVVDVVFKRIFGQDKSICLAFICAVLGWEPSSVQDLQIEFVDKDLIPAYPDSKQSFLDILVK
jgi:PD-(D/E)XK nuclease family transposase